MEKKVFRPGYSVLLIGLLPAICILLMLVIHPGVVYIFLGMFSPLLVLNCRTRYVISENKLYLTILGITSYGSERNITHIISVKRSYCPLVTGSSLKCLRIRFRNHYYSFWVAPFREKEFLEILAKQNPDITIRVDDKKAWYRLWDWNI